MIAAEGAVRQWEAARAGIANGCWVFVNISEDVPRVYWMAASIIGQASRGAVASYSHCQIPNRPDQLTSRHARSFFRLPNGRAVRELGRIRVAEELVNEHLQFVDLARHSVFRGFPSAVDCIRQAIINKVGLGRHVAGIVIDCAKLAVCNWLGDNGLEVDQCLTQCLALFPGQARFLLADGFGCPVWMTHQLSSRTYGRKYSESVGHLDASECGSFCDEVDICVVIGNRDPVRDRRQLYVSKCPQRPSSLKPAVIRFDPVIDMLRGDEHAERDRMLTSGPQEVASRVQIDARTAERLQDVVFESEPWRIQQQTDVGEEVRGSE